MARYQKQRRQYPIGSISSGTMRPEDLIPAFTSTLLWFSRRTAQIGDVSQVRRREHAKLAFEIADRIKQFGNHTDLDYYDSEHAEWDLESLFDALGEYAGPYFYFGAHPGDGADYGFWLSEDWDVEFHDCTTPGDHACTLSKDVNGESIKVNDLADVPAWFRGEVAHVNDHGNVTLYVKTARGLREVWAIV